jgi:hypothetical protein
MADAKRCTKCGETKPHTGFGKDKRASDGFTSACRDCHRESNRRYRAANLEKARESSRKSYASNRARLRAQTLQRQRLWQSSNRTRCREYRLKYRAANLEKDRQRQRAWRAANHEKILALNAARRARKLSALDLTANQEAIAALHAEAKLAEAFTGQPFAVDHIVPLTRGGRHHEDNLRVLPASLNSVKGAKLDHEVSSADFRAWLSDVPSYEQITFRTFH